MRSLRRARIGYQGVSRIDPPTFGCDLAPGIRSPIERRHREPVARITRRVRVEHRPRLVGRMGAGPIAEAVTGWRRRLAETLEPI